MLNKLEDLDFADDLAEISTKRQHLQDKTSEQYKM
jgi:hypothetical protein